MRQGATIDLPMPFPGSWLETVSYMYTGNEELLSERVKHNIWYLGGHPGHVGAEIVNAEGRHLEGAETEMVNS